MSQSGHTGVLLLAHGTPNVLGEMAEYLARVTGGRALPQEVVEELQHRYAQIGLRDRPGLRDSPAPEPPPLTRWTFAQARSLQAALAAAGAPLRVYAGMRNWHPYIEDVVGQMRADGVTRIIAICLAPQNSRTSIGLYRRALMSVADGFDVTFVEEWPDEPALIEAFAQRLIDCYTAIESGAPRLGVPGQLAGWGERLDSQTWDVAPRNRPATALPVLFTAHSVPC